MADTFVKTNAGLAITTNRIKGSGNEPNYMGWGTGTTPAAVTDTGLETPAAESRVAGTSTQQTTNTTNDTYQVAGTLTCAGAGKTISEVGLFDAPTSGNCFIHGTFTGIALNVGDSITFTIKDVIDQA